MQFQDHNGTMFQQYKDRDGNWREIQLDTLPAAQTFTLVPGGHEWHLSPTRELTVTPCHRATECLVCKTHTTTPNSERI